MVDLAAFAATALRAALVLMILSDAIYVAGILAPKERERIETDPIGWGIWSLGGALLAASSYAKGGITEGWWFLAIITALQTAVCLLTLAQPGRVFLMESTRWLSLGLAALGVIGWLGWSDPFPAFVAGMLIDVGGLIAIMRSVRENPFSEGRAAWTLSVLASWTYLVGVVAGQATGQADAWQCSYAVYYATANSVVLCMILTGRWRPGSRFAK